MTHLSSQKRAFTIHEVIAEAWHLMHGHKWHIWAVALWILILSGLIQFLMLRIFHIDPFNTPILHRYLLIPLVKNIVIAPFFGGAVMTAVLCARHKAVNAKTGFRYFNRSLSLIITLFIVTLLANLLLYIVHLPWFSTIIAQTEWWNLPALIVLVIVYVFFWLSIPLVIDQNKTPWEGLTRSYQIIKHHWFKALILFLILYACLTVAIIPLILGLMIPSYLKLLGAAITLVAFIWLMPFLFLVQGVLYHKLVD